MRRGKWEIALRGGAEYDAISGWRKVLAHKPGERKAAKNKFRRRARHHARLDLKSGDITMDMKTDDRHRTSIQH